MGRIKFSLVFMLLCAMSMMAEGVGLAADCSGLSGVAAAQCSFSNMQGDGLTDMSSSPPPETVLPQYSGSSGCADSTCAGASAETSFYTNDGDTSALDAAGVAAASSDPEFSAVQQMRTDAGAWTASSTAPAITAQAVADSMNASPPSSSTTETCVDVSVCTDLDPSPSINLCQSPGISEALCHVKVQSVNTFVVNTGFVGSSILSWCTDNELYLRVRSPHGGLYILEWADVKGAVWDATGNLIGGEAHRFCSATQPGHSTSEVWHTWFTWDLGLSADATPLTDDFVANFTGVVGAAGGCNPFLTSSVSVADGPKLVIVCPSGSPPEQYGTLTLGNIDINSSFQEIIKTDGCAPYRPTGILQETVCLDSAPRTYTDPLAGVYTLNPPLEEPYGGCWDKTEKYIIQAPGLDECLPFLEAGCLQTNSYCVVPTGSTCERYEKEFTCPSGTVCASTTTLSQCSSCGNPGSLVPFCTDRATPPNDQLFLAATYLQLIEDVEDDWDPASLSLFTGEDKDCRYDTGGASIVNCCDSDPDKLFSGGCSEQDIDLAEDREAALTHYVGTHCVREVNLGFTTICVEKEEVYCSFYSKLARIVQEQGRPQIGWTWGDEDNPDCRGFTFEQFKGLDWSLIDMSEYFTDVTASVDVGLVQTDMEAKVCAQLGTC